MQNMDTDVLKELIDRKHHVLSQLSQLAQRQVSVVKQGDMTHLLGVLAAKQKVLSVLQGIERQLDPFRKQDPDSRLWRSPADRQRARDAAQRCESLLGEIISLERQSEENLVHRRDAAAARLQGVHGAAQARHAYAAATLRPGDQLDICSDT